MFHLVQLCSLLASLFVLSFTHIIVAITILARTMWRHTFRCSTSCFSSSSPPFPKSQERRDNTFSSNHGADLHAGISEVNLSGQIQQYCCVCARGYMRSSTCVSAYRRMGRFLGLPQRRFLLSASFWRTWAGSGNDFNCSTALLRRKLRSSRPCGC